MAAIATNTALSKIWSDLLADMLARVDGVIADRDIEDLHKFRVALRKTRALMTLFKKSLPVVEHFAMEFRWIASVTGPVRDIDVLLHYVREQLPALLNISPLDAIPIINELQRQRRYAQTQLQKALRSARWKKLIANWLMFIANDLPTLSEPAALLVSIDVVTKSILLKQCVALLKIADKLNAQTPDSALHRMRIRGKKIRYLLDTTRPFVGKRHRSTLAPTLVKLQDVLGRHQDAVAASARLHEIDTALSRRARSSAARAAVHAWSALLERERIAAREQLPKTLTKFLGACDTLM